MLPNFHSYDTIDTDPSINESGWTVPLSDTFTAFGYSTTTVKVGETLIANEIKSQGEPVKYIFIVTSGE